MLQLCLAFLFFFLNLDFWSGGIAAGQSQAKSQLLPQDVQSKIISSDERYGAFSIEGSDGLDLDIWNSILERFRAGHHLSLGLGLGAGTWDIKNAGILANETRNTRGIVYEFKYSYQLKLADYFGYFVGTSASFYNSTSSASGGFRESSSYRLPSVVAGFSLFPSWRYSVLAGIDYSIERYDELRYSANGVNDQLETKQVGLTLEGPQVFFSFAYYYEARSAVSLTYSYSKLSYIKPADLEFGDASPLDVNLKREQKKMTIGYTYHHF